MNLIKALMENEQIRVSYGNRWIYFDKVSDEWVCMEHKYGAKKSQRLASSPVSDNVVKVLLED